MVPNLDPNVKLHLICEVVMEEFRARDAKYICEYRRYLGRSNITCCNEDFEGIITDHDDPMMILATIANVEVQRVFIDLGSASNVMFYKYFKALEFIDDDFISYEANLVLAPKLILTPEEATR